MNEKKVPQISIVIPMYNVEKYVGECLDSLLCQTFQDFEVIIVDDCSTDNSRNVVQAYLPKFNGKLQLIESEKNSGGCAVPRNIGMNYACGKYLFFLDSDDLIIKNALESLYTVAEEFNADIVQCEKFFTSETPHLKGATLTVKSFKPDSYITVPTLETENITQRIKNFHDQRYVWTAWSKLIRRDFMIENKMKYPLTLNNEDLVFTIYCLSCAKRFVQFPDPVNIYRYRPNSILHSKEYTTTSHVRKWIRSLATGFYCCDKFLSGLEFYKLHPEIKYLALDAITQDIFRHLFVVYKKFSAALLDDIIREEFSKAGDSSALATFFFNMSILYSMQIGSYLLDKQNNT
ncbi:MAG: glycosyltransferase [Selenomonadaceae bacterium]|nr:glycosyltransferase [Selenomonadaceae bacterium]